MNLTKNCSNIVIVKYFAYNNCVVKISYLENSIE